jgi:hypothetical protein
LTLRRWMLRRWLTLPSRWDIPAEPVVQA